MNGGRGMMLGDRTIAIHRGYNNVGLPRPIFIFITFLFLPWAVVLSSSQQVVVLWVSQVVVLVLHVPP